MKVKIDSKDCFASLAMTSCSYCEAEGGGSLSLRAHIVSEEIS